MVFVGFVVGVTVSLTLITVGFGNEHLFSPGESFLVLYSIFATGSICAVLVKIWQLKHEVKVLQQEVDRVGKIRQFLNTFISGEHVQNQVDTKLTRYADEVHNAVQSVIQFQQSGLSRLENETDEKFQSRYEAFRVWLENNLKTRMDSFYAVYDVVADVPKVHFVSFLATLMLLDRSWENYVSEDLKTPSS